MSYAFKALNLFFKYTADKKDDKAVLTDEQKIEIETLFKEAIHIRPSALNWFLYACYLGKVFKDEGVSANTPEKILAAFSQAMKQGIHDRDFQNLVIKKMGDILEVNAIEEALKALAPYLNFSIDSLGNISSPSANHFSSSSSLLDNKEFLKKMGIKVLFDPNKDLVADQSSTKEKAGPSGKKLLRQLIIEKAKEEKAAQEKNAPAAAVSSSGSSSSSANSSKVNKKDLAALQEFAEKQREAEALEEARRQKELDLEREEKAKNREQRIPKHVLKQQEILRKKEQDKLLQEQQKKEQKKKPNVVKPIVQNTETFSVSTEPSSYSSSANATSSYS